VEKGEKKAGIKNKTCKKKKPPKGLPVYHRKEGVGRAKGSICSFKSIIFLRKAPRVRATHVEEKIGFFERKSLKLYVSSAKIWEIDAGEKKEVEKYG